MPVSLMDSRGLYKTLLISFALIIQQRIKLLSKRKLVFKSFKNSPTGQYEISPQSFCPAGKTSDAAVQNLVWKYLSAHSHSLSSPTVQMLAPQEAEKEKKISIDATWTQLSYDSTEPLGQALILKSGFQLGFL